ncbi:FtsX-like permease family protein [Pseudoroseomonas wenyumeiae]|uniref:FtsX-like permease family protein n=1 Tax=Teichococcus wenyumeiae TaxID=2478470 RepID=A0A3A9JEG8_9PROT|nr:FtsX-like permease family protein [Pseudoroseomonas wenyumeiae]RKK01904.1 FtsX-like permease family protein [Pseudoroseomonas wenyumeiae]RMI20834.1 FtsX-like permease family protein [Pseudoroseomonas wenyumeiae]
MSNLALGLRFARRELRGGIKGLRIVLACLALGVAAIAAVGVLRAATEAGLAEDGARILGGDLSIRVSYRPLPQDARDWITSRGGRLSETIEMRAMAIAPNGQRTLVELKAADAAYPLYGALELDPPHAALTPEAPGAPAGVALEPLVADRLGLKPGDRLRLGEESFVLAALIRTEPDKVASPALLGPRALIPLAALEGTKLVQPGSLVQYEYRVALGPNVSPQAFAKDFQAAHDDGGWRIRDASQAAPGVNRVLDRVASFLTLAGLTALLVGGIGVATGVRSWLDQRARTIATLRCLGAPPGAVFATYMIQVLALSVLGIVIGLAAGQGLAVLAGKLLETALPVPPRIALYPWPLVQAALYGILTALSFSLWPLGRAREIPGAALFRDTLAPRAARPRASLLLANGLAVLALVGLVVGTAAQPGFALAFCAAAGATLLLFRLGASLLMLLAKRIRAGQRPTLRLGLANLHRPGAPTALLLVALGIGLTTLSALALIEGNLRRQIEGQIPAQAPNFFFIDIQSDQTQRFDQLTAGLQGVQEVKRVPSLRARIVSVKGVPADQVQATEDTRWALSGDRGLTYAATPPEGTRITEGRWWAPDYKGAPLVSLDANLARGWNVALGDEIVVNVLGRDVPLKVASLRQIEWQGLGLNFTLIASPGLLEAAPHTHIATLRGDAAQDAAVLRAVTDAFPNVSGIRVRDALDAVGTIMQKLGTAISAVAAVTLLAGGLVLAGAMAAGQRRRVRDAVVLKVIGATRAQVRRAWMVEFGLLGFTAGVLAAAIGTAASWGVARYVMKTDWVFLPVTLAVTVLGCTLLTLVLGYAGTALALRARPAPLLRNE